MQINGARFFLTSRRKRATLKVCYDKGDTMGILESLATDFLKGAMGRTTGKKTGRKSGSAKSNQSTQLAEAVLEIVLRVGVPKLIEMFNDAGLKKKISSWIEPGENQAISPAEVKKALGSTLIGEIAKKTGMKSPTVASGLAKSLPMVIDALTPDGDTDDAHVKKASSSLDLGEIGTLLGAFLKS